MPVTTDIVDIWVNLVTGEGAKEFLGQEQFANIPGYLGSSSTDGIGTDSMIALMDELGVTTGVLCTGMDRTADHALEVADQYPGRFLVAAGLTSPERPTKFAPAGSRWPSPAAWAARSCSMI